MNNHREMKMNLALLNDDVKMNSYEFLNDVINPCREIGGEDVWVRHNDFLSRVKDELDDHVLATKIITPKLVGRGGNRNSFEVVELGMEQMLLVGMRESKAVRRAVLAKLKEMQAKLEAKNNVALISHYEEEIKQLRQTIDRKNAEMSVNSTLYNDLLQKLWTLQDKMNIDTQLSDENHWLKRQLAEVRQEIYQMESVVTTTQQQNRNVMIAVNNAMQIENKVA